MIEKIAETMYEAVIKSYNLYYQNWESGRSKNAWDGLCLYNSFGQLINSFKNRFDAQTAEIIEAIPLETAYLKEAYFDNKPFPSLSERKKRKDMILAAGMIFKVCKKISSQKDNVLNFLAKNYNELYWELASSGHFFPKMVLSAKKTIRNISGQSSEIYSSYEADILEFESGRIEFMIMNRITELGYGIKSKAPLGTKKESSHISSLEEEYKRTNRMLNEFLEERKKLDIL